MKKIAFFLIGLIVFSSCSSESPNGISANFSEPTLSEREQQEFNAVMARIDSLNQSIIANNNDTRGFKDWFKRFTAIVISDAAGAIFGATLGPIGSAGGAVVASAVAAAVPLDHISIGKQSSDVGLTFAPMNSIELSLSPSLIPITTEDEVMSAQDSIGYYHNRMMITMASGSENDDLNLDYIITKTSDMAFETYHSTREEVLVCLNENRPFFESIKKNIIPLRDNAEDVHSVIDTFILLYPEYKPQFNVLRSFFEGLANVEVEENNGDYMNQVLEIINDSSLPAATKRELRNATIVGNASYQLWTVKN